MNTLLSVVIPCFNAGKYIGELLDCCIKQTFNDWEVIVVDDNSTDNNTKKILNGYSSKDERIHIIDRDRLPKGGDTCRNIGLDNVRGKYVIIFDADDLISNDCFEQRVRFMEENEDCDYASFPAAYFIDGNPLPKWGRTKMTIGIDRGNQDLLSGLLTYNYPFTVWSNIYKYKSIKGIMWDENLLVMQDFDWMVSCELSGLKHKYCNIQQYDYYYRQFLDGHNVCGTFVSIPKCQSINYLFEKTLLRLKEREDYEERKNQFYMYVTIHLNRLIVGDSIEEAERFVQLCSKFYSSKQISALSNVLNNCFNRMYSVEKGVISPIYLYYTCFINYKMKRYLGYFVKNVIKAFINRRQDFYQ